MRPLKRRFRRGSAALELVLVFPTFLLILAANLWMAGNIIAKIRVTSQARYTADSVRSAEQLPGGLSQPLESWDAKSDIQNIAAQKSINLFPNLFRTAPTRSSHTVLLGSWDHRQLKLETVPDYQLAFRLAAKAPSRGVARRANAAKSLFSDFRSLANDFGQIFSLNQQDVFRRLPQLVPAVGFKSSTNSSDPAVQNVQAQTLPLVEEQIQSIVGQSDQMSQVMDWIAKIKGGRARGERELVQKNEEYKRQARRYRDFQTQANQHAQTIRTAKQEIRQLLNDDMLELKNKADKVLAAASRAATALRGIHSRVKAVESNKSRPLSEEEKAQLREGKAADVNLRDIGVNGTNDYHLKDALTAYASEAGGPLSNKVGGSVWVRNTPRQLSSNGFFGVAGQVDGLNRDLVQARKGLESDDDSVSKKAERDIDDFSAELESILDFSLTAIERLGNWAGQLGSMAP